MNVRFRHEDYAPDGRPLAPIVRPGESAEAAIPAPVPFEASEDQSELIAGGMIAY
jgi:hypothetical protein